MNGQQQPGASSTLRKCSLESCTNRGTLMCTRCKTTYYCSRDCQKRDWRSGHKSACVQEVESASHRSMDPSANCFIIRANGRNPVAADISSQIAPLDLKSYGRGEAYEKKELCQRLGWQQVWSMTEEINFYGHEGEDGWYYFAYGPNQEQMRLRSLQDKTDNLPKGPKWNGIASMLTDGKRDIWGDVAVVRSGPASPSNKYEEVFNGKDLEATLNWYLKGRKVGKIYDEREKSRAMRMYFGNGSAMNMNGAQYMNFKF